VEVLGGVVLIEKAINHVSGVTCSSEGVVGDLEMGPGERSSLDEGRVAIEDSAMQIDLLSKVFDWAPSYHRALNNLLLDLGERRWVLIEKRETRLLRRRDTIL